MRKLVALTVVALAATLAGCGESVLFRSEPPGARLFVSDKLIGTTPVTYLTEPKPDLTKPRPYRVELEGYPPSEGQLTTRFSGGRLTGAIFTLGILKAVRSLRVFSSDVIDVALAPPPPPIDDDKVAYFLADGTGRIKGQAFGRTVGGDVKFAAGEKVFLHPDCTEIRDFYQHAQNSENPNMGPALGKYSLLTTADAEGRFEFEDLASGAYFIVTAVRWGAPTGYGIQLQGGLLTARVVVHEGRTVKAILTH